MKKTPKKSLLTKGAISTREGHYSNIRYIQPRWPANREPAAKLKHPDTRSRRARLFPPLPLHRTEISAQAYTTLMASRTTRPIETRPIKTHPRTTGSTDSSPHGQFAPRTVRPMYSSPHGQFAPWTVRPTDSLPHGQFAPRTVRPMDNSPHGQLAPWWVSWLFWWVLFATMPGSSVNSWDSWFIFNLRKNKHLLWHG